eukprot:14230-Eustigmatos_ZCMA.PRE.1
MPQQGQTDQRPGSANRRPDRHPPQGPARRPGRHAPGVQPLMNGRIVPPAHTRSPRNHHGSGTARSRFHKF